MTENSSMDLDDIPAPAMHLIISRLGATEWPFLRQVSRRWRGAVDLAISRIQPLYLPRGFAKKFPNIQALDISSIAVPLGRKHTYQLLAQLPSLTELRIPDLSVFEGIGGPLSSGEDWVTKLVVTRFVKETDSQPLQSWHNLTVFQDQTHPSLRPGRLSSASRDRSGDVIRLTFSKPVLRILEVEEATLQANWQAIVQQSQLSELAVKRLDKIALAQLGQLTSLQCLHILSASTVPARAFEELNSLRLLTNLKVANCAVTATDICKATALTTLQSLSLPGCWAFTSSALTKLAKTFPQLTHLDLTDTRAQHLGNMQSFGGLSAISSLQRLDLSCSDLNMDMEAFNAVEDMRSLTYLGLSFTHRRCVTDATMASICTLRNLQCLGLCNSHITDTGASHLSNLTSLTDLDISMCTRLTRQCLVALASSPLIFLRCDFGVEDMLALNSRLALAILRAQRCFSYRQQAGAMPDQD